MKMISLLVLTQGMTQPFWIAESDRKVKYGPETLEDNVKDHIIDINDKDTESGPGGCLYSL